MFPAARLVLPEEYGQAFWHAFYRQEASVSIDDQYLALYELHLKMRYYDPLILVNKDWRNLDLRHPVDIFWGKVHGLEKPKAGGYRPWKTTGQL